MTNTSMETVVLTRSTMALNAVTFGVVEPGASSWAYRMATVFLSTLSFSSTEAPFEKSSSPEPPGLVLSSLTQEELKDSAGEGSADESISIV